MHRRCRQDPAQWLVPDFCEEEMICERCGCECGGNMEIDEEYKANFGCYATDAKGILCDDCYEAFWKWAKVNAPELMRKK